MKKKNGCKFLSLFLVFVLIFSIITTGFIPAYAAEEDLEGYKAEAVGNPDIIAFGELVPEIAVQDEETSVTDAVYASDVARVNVLDVSDETPPVPGGSGIISIQSYYTTSSKIILSWTKAADDVSEQNQLKYYVYRSNADNIRTVEECEANGELQNAGGSMDIETFSPGWPDYTNTYYYNVIVEDGAGNKAAYQPVVRNGIQITQPMSATIAYGYSHTLSVSAFSDPEEPISYQWYYNTIDVYGSDARELPGATDKNFNTPDDLSAGIHYYFCKVSIKGGVFGLIPIEL